MQYFTHLYLTLQLFTTILKDKQNLFPKKNIRGE